MSDYIDDDISPEEFDRQAALYAPFTDAVRGLVDATIRSEVDDEEIRAVQAEVEALTARLRAKQLPGSFGVRFSTTGGPTRPWGNAVMGLRNPIAPPLKIEMDPAGRTRSEFHLGAAYEGPPGLVHGGVSALLLDQMVGQAASAGGHPGMTGTLTVRYRRGTPLGDLTSEAWIESFDGPKTFVKGWIADAEGITVEAEAIMVLPRWARTEMAERADGAPKMFE